MTDHLSADSHLSESAHEIDALRRERDELLARISQQAAWIVRAEEDLRRALSESQAMYLSSLDISGQLDLPTVLRAILRRAIGLINAEMGVIYQVEQETGELLCIASHNDADQELGNRLRAGDGLAGRVLIDGLPRIIPNYSEWEFRNAAIAKRYNHRAVAAVPLRWQTAIIGVMVLATSSPSAEFTPDDLESVQRFTVQAAIAIHAAQVSQQEKERSRQLLTIYEVSAQLAEAVDPSALLRDIARSLVAALDVTHCRILELHPTDGLFVQYDYDGLDETNTALPGAKDTLSQLKPVRAMILAQEWMVFQRNDPLLQPEVGSYMQNWDLQSLLIVPMVSNQRPIGLVMLGEGRYPRRISTGEVSTISALVAQMVVALRHIQLQQQFRSQVVNEQRILLALSQRLLELHDRQAVASYVVRAVADALSLTHVNLLVPDGDTLRSFAALGFDSYLNVRLASSQPVAVTGIQYAITMHEAVVIDDVLAEARFVVPASLSDEGQRSAVITPILVRDRLLGVLVVARPVPRGFSADDVRLLKLLMAQTGVAFERATLFESVQRHAEQLEARIADRTLAVSAERERIDALFATTDEELIVFDYEGVIQQVNRAFERQHRVSATQVIGQTALEALGQDLPRYAGPKDRHDVWRGEATIRRPDGTFYEAAVTLSWVHSTSGEATGIIASLRDLSYRQEVDSLKAQFVSGVSHELRTPLANIKLYLHLLEGGAEVRRPQYLATLKRETARLQALIEDLLAISRLERNSVALDLRPVEINDMIQALIDDRRDLAQQNNLTLESRLSPFALTTLADERMLVQAVTNLLANATNYTHPGGKIIVETGLDTSFDPPLVSITVSDNGIGIAPDEKGRLFERFFRGSAAQKTGAAGTGLGMSIVKEIMDRMGGSITFDSELGQGSSFTLYLPIRSE